jgi:hypothetical protein
MSGWQKQTEPSARPSFSGIWQLDSAKSKTDMKDVVWKIDQKESEILIEETTGGKALCAAKCPIGKPCEFEDSGKKMGAMTYFLDKSLVQTRSAADNSTVIKRQLKMNDDGSLRVEMIQIVPSDKTDVLVFTKQAASAPVAAAPKQ